MKYQILQGDNRETLKTIADNSIDAIVTDPPYGIDFLGKAWDANTGALETYQECLRVLKPGGHILAFSAARTYHHLAITLEQAGFEIRDQIMWIYSSGFPKSQDIGKSIQRSLGIKETKTIKGGARPSDKMVTPYAEENEYTQPILTDPEAKQWAGWGTALKPAHEPIALARKPIKLSIAKNAQKWGTGALNIDATRIASDEPLCGSGKKNDDGTYTRHTGKEFGQGMMPAVEYDPNQGRFPSNVLGEIPDYQKYFYCPKVSRKERHIGFDDANSTKSMLDDMGASYIDDKGNPVPYEERNNKPQIYIPGVGAIYTHGLKDEYAKWCKHNNVSQGAVGNNHPTVKPVALMEYLIKLITPPGGVVLDPFNGSGSTGMAAVGLGYNYIGCELDPAYVEISEKRIEAWIKKDPLTALGLFE